MASDAMSWAHALSDEDTRTILQESVIFTLHKIAGSESLTPIGMLRMITDQVTFTYTSDVIVLEEYRKLGLGKWMIECAGETMVGMKDLRWSLVFSIAGHAERLYQDIFKTVILGASDQGLHIMGATRQQLLAAPGAHVEGLDSWIGLSTRQRRATRKELRELQEDKLGFEDWGVTGKNPRGTAHHKVLHIVQTTIIFALLIVIIWMSSK